MGRDEDWRWDEEGCIECGELHYTRSRVAGLCKECYEQAYELPGHQATNGEDGYASSSFDSFSVATSPFSQPSATG